MPCIEIDPRTFTLTFKDTQGNRISHEDYFELIRITIDKIINH